MSDMTVLYIDGAIIVVQSASFMRLTYAGAVSLVDRKRTAHPNLFRAKKEIMASKHDGVRRATTGALSLEES